jgi:hypothetical protein
VEADALLGQLAAVFEPGQLKVKPLVGEDLPLQCGLGIGRGFAALLNPTV